MIGTSDRWTVWLVESFHNGKSDGYWAGVPKSEGGWLTENAWAAKQYTESEAKAVADALDYFPTPFRWSHWVATEHVFIGVDTHIGRTDGSGDCSGLERFQTAQPTPDEPGEGKR